MRRPIISYYRLSMWWKYWTRPEIRRCWSAVKKIDKVRELWPFGWRLSEFRLVSEAQLTELKLGAKCAGLGPCFWVSFESDRVLEGAHPTVVGYYVRAILDQRFQVLWSSVGPGIG